MISKSTRAGFLIIALLNAVPAHARSGAAPAGVVPPSPSFFRTQRTGEFTEPFSGMKFVPLKGGTFKMGDGFNEGDKDEQPVHDVTISGFAMGKYAVTRGEFRKFVTSTGYRTDAEKGEGCYVQTGDIWNYEEGTSWKNPLFHQDDKHPVVCVSWNDATAYAAWLSKKIGKRLRLPTEAEWEYAARSGGKRERFAGFSDPALFFKYGNFCDRNCLADWRDTKQNDGFRFTAPAGSYLPNGLGLYDMTGNVFQWTQDYYSNTYYRESNSKLPLDSLYGGDKRRESAKNNPKGPAEGRYRTLRGSSWNSVLMDSRTSQRLRNKPEYRRSYIGFRLVMPVPKNNTRSDEGSGS